MTNEEIARQMKRSNLMGHIELIETALESLPAGSAYRADLEAKLAANLAEHEALAPKRF